MLELTPDLIHPILNKSIRQLELECDDKDQPIKVEVVIFRFYRKNPRVQYLLLQKHLESVLCQLVVFPQLHRRH